MRRARLALVVAAAIHAAIAASGCSGGGGGGGSGSSSSGPQSGVQVRFDADDPEGSPFPSDRFTVEDRSQNTGLRVDMPLPASCGATPNDCVEVDALDDLDGFNITPRISIPFAALPTGSSDVDLASVTSGAVFLVRLESTLPSAVTGGGRVGINQVVWDVATRTLHVEADEQLDQHTRYALFVTSRVRDASGLPIRCDAFASFLSGAPPADLRLRAYRDELILALASLPAGEEAVVASVFTTLSCTSELEKIREQIQAATPGPLAFGLVSFALASVTSVANRVQTGTAPTFAAPVSYTAFLTSRPGAIGAIGFGKFVSPDYRDAARVFPPTRTLLDAPAPVTSNVVVFDVYLPSGAMPTGGWPVAIVGHGATAHKNNGPPALVAATFASRGIAVIAINGPGNGGGPLSTIIVGLATGTAVTVSSGGRQVDVDGNGAFAVHEGGDAAFFPYRGRDRMRQCVVDLLQLTRVIQAGVDVDGDGLRDLDPSRIYYAGQSMGGLYGAIFTAVEPRVRACALNVPFAFFTAGSNISPVLGRPNAGAALLARVPSMINPPGTPVITKIGGVTVTGAPATLFNEDLPLRNQAPVVSTITGAMAIQRAFEISEWVQQRGSASAFAPHLRARPLDGAAPRPILLSFAKGDQSAPNPLTVDLVRAGGLADVTTLYRHDIAFARNPSLAKDPHNHIAQTLGPTSGGFASAGAGTIARAVQEQMADFLASDGATIADPDGADTLFETPIALPLLESDLSYIP